jgi:hypothetical protein
MQSSFCKYEDKEKCVLLKKPCVPGQKGCVLGNKVIIQNSKLKIDAKTYKNKNIARFRED